MDHSKRPPKRPLFFAPLLVSLKPDEVEAIAFAYEVSKHGHQKQVRSDGSRYFDHPKSVAWIYMDEFKGRDPAIIILCLLHDMSEDSYLLSPYRLAHNFGEERALDVAALTKLPEGMETTTEYLSRVVARGAATIMTKLLDRLHNLRTLGSKTEEKQIKTIAETREFHIRILLPALRTHGKKWVGVADKLERLIDEALMALSK